MGVRSNPAPSSPIAPIIIHTACYLLFGRTFLPGGGAWAVIILWLGAQVRRDEGEQAGRRSSHMSPPPLSISPSIHPILHPSPLQTGGALISFLGLHPLLGQLLVGVALQNIPVPWLVRGLPIPWRAKIQQGALALISFLGLHPLLGQLLVGVALQNIPVPWLVRGLPIPWRAKIRQGALALIFLRSGLELDWRTFRRAGPAATRLLLIPGIVEALISGSVARAVFGMPWMLALALGFILKAVGPAIIIQLMFDLQKRGWGVDKGIPALVVAAASFDDLVAIFFYTLFINLAVKGPSAGGGGASSGGNTSLALDLASGPISIVAGLAGGVALGGVAAITRLWSSRRKRTAAVVVLGKREGERVEERRRVAVSRSLAESE